MKQVTHLDIYTQEVALNYNIENIVTLALLNRSLIRAEPTPTKTSTNSDPAI